MKNFCHNRFFVGCDTKKSVMAVCLIVCAAMAASCRSAKTITQEVPVYIHDTIKDTKEVHDSTYIDRWHTEYQKGDTVFVTNEMTKIKVVTKTDTTYQYVEVPITVKEAEVVEVKKPLNWFQKTLMWLGAGFILVVIGFGISLYFYITKRSSL